MNRGDRREAIFEDSVDPDRFLATLAVAGTRLCRCKAAPTAISRPPGTTFRQELLEQVNVPPGTSHFGPAVQEAAEARAERMTRAALQRIGWTGDELKRRPKGDPDNIMIA